MVFDQDFQVNRMDGSPIYLQIKEQILEKVRNGQCQPGEQLPTERHLAEKLGVSRNTVSMAYRELEAEGMLASFQGRGTFVTASDTVGTSEGGQERVQQMVDLILEEADQWGLTSEEVADLFNARIYNKRAMLRQVQVAFIECNREQVEFFSRQLHLGAGINIIPVLLQEFLEHPDPLGELLADVDLVVTTFFHVEEVHDRLHGQRRLLAVALEPELNSMVRIARRFPETHSLLVCLTDSFARSVRIYLGQSGVDTTNLRHTTARDAEVLQDQLQGIDMVLVSPGRKREVTELADPEAEVVEFILKPDEGSVSRLKAAVLELQRKA